MAKTSSWIKVVNLLEDGCKSAGIEKTTRKLIKSIPIEYCRGLDVLLIRNVDDLRRHERREKVRSRRGKTAKSKIRGLYRHSTKKHAAQIELFADNIFKGYPSWTPLLPIVRELFIAQVLFHEVGHHIHETGSARGSKEKVADEWKTQLIKTYAEQHRPFLLRYANVIAKLLRRLVKLLKLIRRS